MHRHGYKGRKFGRERDQRRALRRGLMLSLVREGAITTTLPKTKDIRPDFEKLVTKARKGGLANRRIVIAKLGNVEAGNLLVDIIAPQIKRDSGYIRIVKLDERRVGDNAEMARIEFVDEINYETANPEPKPTEKPAAKTPTTKKGEK